MLNVINTEEPYKVIEVALPKTKRQVSKNDGHMTWLKIKTVPIV